MVEGACLPSRLIIMELPTQKKGAVTELRVASYLIELGYTVSAPFNPDSKYDLILDVNNQLLRIQVKTSRISPKTDNSIVFNCRSTTKNVSKCQSRRYTKEDIDYFATYWNNKVYLIPVEKCSAEKTLHLLPVSYSNQSYIEDFLADEILKNII